MKGDHQPDRNGGCWTFTWCECVRVAGNHCGYCGRAVERIEGRMPGAYSLRHTGTPARLAALNSARAPK